MGDLRSFGMGSYGPEEATTKHAKMGERIVYKEESYRIIGACFDEIIVEIKAVKQLADEHRAQVINYLKSTGKQLGLLVNFGCHPKLEYERFVNQSLSRVSRIS